MNRISIIILSALSFWLLTFGISKSEAVEDNGSTSHLIAVIGNQGISFFRIQSYGSLQSIGGLPKNFGIEGISSSDWLISGTGSLVTSPKRDQVAFSAHRGTENALFIYSVSQGDLQQTAIPYPVTPIWSPHGDALLLAAPPLAYVYEIVSHQLTEITHAPNEVGGNFQWLPDATALFYLGLDTTSPPKNIEIYVVNRDGSNRHRLTHTSSVVPANANRSICNLTWSPANSRIYYVVGCLGFKDNPRDYVFSVNLAGENRLEVALPTAFKEDASVTAVTNMVATTDGPVITYQADLVNGDHHWRVINLTPQGELQLRFDYHFDAPRELYDAKISPDNKHVAIVGLTDEDIYGSIHLLVGNFDDNQIAADLDGTDDHICNIDWDDQNVLYETTDIPCFGNKSKPIATWQLDIPTQKTVNISESLGKISWVLHG